MGRITIRSPWLPGVFAAALLGACGCSFVDDFSIKRFNFEDFSSPKDPLSVLTDRKCVDGKKRCNAIACLHEPLQNRGSQADQDAYVKVLTVLATTDTQATCRMAAIAMLQNYKDPRAVEALRDAYYRAGSFNSEVGTVLRTQALEAMGYTRNPVAVETLVRVLRAPPTEGPDVDRQQKIDERIAAAHALGYFNQPEALAALVEVLRKDDDVALRKRAHESLIEATGRNLPADAVAWEEAMKPGVPRSNRDSGIGGRLLELTGHR